VPRRSDANEGEDEKGRRGCQGARESRLEKSEGESANKTIGRAKDSLGSGGRPTCTQKEQNGRVANRVYVQEGQETEETRTSNSSEAGAWEDIKSYGWEVEFDDRAELHWRRGDNPQHPLKTQVTIFGRNASFQKI